MTGEPRYGIIIAMTHRYTLVLEREVEGGYHVSCPALPGCHSQGETVDEAIANGTEAIEVYLESLIAHQQ
jgi:predicted RNase H-like HicB family nuclease